MNDFDVQGKMPEIEDGRVSFSKGFFQETLPGFLETFEPSLPLVIHNDSDIYSSALYILTRLDRRLAPGSLVLFDQWGRDDEYRAFADYTKAYRKRLIPIATMNESFDKIVFVVEHQGTVEATFSRSTD